MTPFPCHQTIKGSGQAFEDDTLEGCAGAAIFMNNKIERSRCPETAAHQDACAAVPDDVKASVFQWDHEFIDHHTAGPERLLQAAGDRPIIAPSRVVTVEEVREIYGDPSDEPDSPT